MFSKLERFPADKKCAAPPVGAYDPKFPTKPIGPVSFKKSPREKAVKFEGPAVGQYDPKYPCQKIGRHVSNMSKSGSESISSPTTTTCWTRTFFRQKKKVKRRSKSADNVNCDKYDYFSTESLNSKQEEIREIFEGDKETTISCEELPISFVDALQQTELISQNSVASESDVFTDPEFERINCELASLKEEKNKIEIEAENLRCEMAKVLPELNEQKSLVANLVSETNSVRSRFDELVICHQELQEKFQENAQEVQQKSNETLVVVEQNSVLHQQMAELCKTIFHLESTNEKLTNDKEKLRNTFENKGKVLQSQISVLNNEVKMKEAFWIEAKAGFDTILTESDENMSALQAENERLKGKMCKTLNLLTNNKEQIRQLKLERESLNEFAKAITVENSQSFGEIGNKFLSLADAVEETERENVRLLDENKKLLAIVEELEQNEAKGKEMMVQVEDDCRKYSEEVDNLKLVLDALNNNRTKFQVENEQLQTDLDEQRKLLETVTVEKVLLLEQTSIMCEENRNIKNKNCQLEEEILLNVDRVNQLKQEISKFQIKNQHLQAKLVEQVKFIEIITMEKTRFENDSLDLLQQTSIICEENGKIKNKNRQLEEQMRLTADRLDELKKEVSKFQIDKQQLEAKVDEQGKLLEIITMEKTRFENENRDLLQQTSIICEENDKIKNKNCQLEEQIRLNADLLDQLHQKVSKFQIENQKLEAKVDEQRKLIEIVTMEKTRFENDNRDLLQQMLIFCEENDKIKTKNFQLEEETKFNADRLEQLTQEVEEVRKELEYLKEGHNSLCNSYEALKRHYDNESGKILDVLKGENAELKSKTSLVMKKVEELNEIIQNNATDFEVCRQERNDYERQLNELIEKIEPFKEQLDLYENERNALADRENESEETLKALMNKYATLLSHQNQKQKIHHINKLKDELLKLRQENRELNKEYTKLKCHTDSLQDKLLKMEGKRKFDPSEAFNFGDKENNLLRTVNKKF